MQALSQSHSKQLRLLSNPAGCANHDLPCCRGHSRIWRTAPQPPKLADRSSGGVTGDLATQLSGMSMTVLKSETAGATVTQRLPGLSATAALLSAASEPQGRDRRLPDTSKVSVHS